MPDGPTTAPTEWESLQTLRRDEELGPAVKWSFAWLWHFAGCQPGYVVIKARDLGCEFGVSPQAAGKWLKALAENSLIEIIDRDRGRLHIYVFNPNPAKRLPRPDPQRRLFEPSTDANLSQAKGSTPAKGANLSHAKGSNLSHAKGSTPCKETPENTGSPPDAPNLSRPKGSPPFIDTKEEENFNLPKSQRSDQSVVNDIEGPSGGSGLAKAMAHLESGLLATLERIDSGGPRRAPETNRGPQRMGEDVFADAAIARLEASATPAEQKQRLKARIKSVCGVGPKGPLADWTAGQTADLVIHGHLPEEDLGRILQDIEAMRGAGTLENGPALFCSKVKQRANQLGLPFGKQKKAPQP